MITKFLLTDNCDDNFTDLIIFDKPVNKNDVYNAINKVTTELAGTYTNEDIYHGIDTLNVDYNIIDLIDIEQIYY
ncbi:MAG: hypothetical protein V8Q75_03415 [Bacilli bacterium]